MAQPGTDRSMQEGAAAVAAEAMDLARSEIAALRERVEALMSERVSPALSEAAGEADRVAQATSGALRRQKRVMAHNIRSQPFAAVGAAALVGLALGLAMRR